MGALVLMGGEWFGKNQRMRGTPMPLPPTMENHKYYCSKTLGMFFGNFSLWSSVLKIFLVNFLFLTHFTGYLWLLKKIKLFLRTHF